MTRALLMTLLLTLSGCTFDVASFLRDASVGPDGDASMDAPVDGVMNMNEAGGNDGPGPDGPIPDGPAPDTMPDTTPDMMPDVTYTPDQCGLDDDPSRTACTHVSAGGSEKCELWGSQWKCRCSTFANGNTCCTTATVHSTCGGMENFFCCL